MYICCTLIIVGAILKILHYLPLLAAILVIIGCFGSFLLYAIITGKYIKRKDKIGKGLKICYVFGFSIATLWLLYQIRVLCCSRSFLNEITFLGFIFLGMSFYLGYIHGQIEKEEAKLKEETENTTA